MRTIELFDAGELAEEDLRAVSQSQRFQEILFYHQLSSDLEELQNNEALVNGIATTLAKHHSQVQSPEIIRETLILFSREITTSRESADNEIPAKIQQHLFDLQQPAKEISPSRDEAKAILREFFKSQLKDVNKIELKAKDIAAETGLKSSRVGSILGRWRRADDAPFAVSAIEYVGRGHTWKISPV